MSKRKYLPTLAELIDRLSIIQLKEVFITVDYTAAAGYSHKVAGIAASSVAKVSTLATASIGKINTVD